MNGWASVLTHDPLPALLASSNPTVRGRAEVDLLDRRPTHDLDPQADKVVGRLTRSQRPNGSWKHTASRGPDLHYDYLETYRNLGLLVEKYSLGRGHPTVAGAADFLLSLQTPEGDIRGVYWDQLSPNYTAAVMELLIKAGYDEHEAIRKGFEWLLSVRQDDGGWAIPIRTRGLRYRDFASRDAGTFRPDTTKPSSHMVTGVVLRAFAAHPSMRSSPAARQAGDLLASRLFAPDMYPDRKDRSYWLKFSFPFWFTDLLSALDSLSRLGFSPDEKSIAAGIAWFVDHQREDGTWRLNYLRDGDKDVDLWVHLAICRTLKRFYS